MGSTIPQIRSSTILSTSGIRKVVSARVNPKYSNVCAVRIGTWRDEQCYNCRFLTECDKLYDEKTGLFDYPKQSLGARSVKVKKGGLYDHISQIPFRDG